MTVVDGQTASIVFTDPSDSVDIALDETNFCGNRLFEIYDESASNLIPWITVAESGTGSFDITASPVSVNGELITTHNFTLKASSVQYPELQPTYTNFTVVVEAPDPCEEATLNQITGLGILTVVDGETDSLDFIDPSDSVGAAL